MSQGDACSASGHTGAAALRGEPYRGAVPEILPQPASSPSRSSVGVWWPCCPEEGGQLRKHRGGAQGVPSGFGAECGRQGGRQWGPGSVLGLVAAQGCWGWGRLPSAGPGLAVVPCLVP